MFSTGPRHWTDRRLLTASSALILCLGVGCSVEEEPAPSRPGPGCAEGRCDGFDAATGFDHRWAIDLQKVRAQASHYLTSGRVVGVEPSKVIPDPTLAAAACEREWIVQEGGGPAEPGGCFLWGGMQRRNYDHSEHVDDPEGAPIVNIVDGDRTIDPPGYLNVVAMFNAARHEQYEIRSALRNGDILVYFHPEDSDTMQYQMHHAAMFYDTGEGPLAINVGGVPYVHHIDNPTSYGPSFTGGATSVPFHVFRFSPNGAPNVGPRDASGRYRFPCNDSIRDAGGPPECQAGEETFSITDEMAAQYAYIARNWALLTNEHAPFASFHDMSWNDAGQRAALGYDVLDEVDRYAAPAIARGEIPEVYCAGLVFTNLNLALNRPMNQAALGPLWGDFQGMTVDFSDRYMRTSISSDRLVDTMGLPSMGGLVFEPITASDILDAWLDGYMRPLSRQHRAALLAAGASRIAQGFGELEWAATKDPEGREDDAVVATPARIQEYAAAYAAGGETLAAWKARERQYVENRYTPPFIYHWMANRADSPVTYVATVFPVDLLAPIGDNDGSVHTGEVSEYIEGGPDTSLYPTFRVPNGGRHVQRVLAIGAGPEIIGWGSAISTRITAADIRDVRLVLHPPGTFPAFPDPRACNDDDGCIGDAPGIAVPLDAALNGGATAWDDVDVTFPLFSPVDEGGLGCEFVDDRGTSECPAFDWATGEASHTERLRIREAHGQWALTVLDVGASSAGATLPNCAACTTGGAHSNQWVVMVRAGRPQGTIRVVSPAEGSTVDNPVTFRIEASEDVASVTATAEGIGPLTEYPVYLEYEDEFRYGFREPGREVTVNITGYDADQQPVARGSVTFTVVGEPCGVLRILSPADGAAVRNPVVFEYEVSPDVLRLEIYADGPHGAFSYTLASDYRPDPSGHGTFPYTFSSDGRERTVTFAGFGDDWRRLAETSVRFTPLAR